jgi:hypothetical protein
METHCKCCGIKFGSGKDAMWITTSTEEASGKICIWCAGNLPGALVNVIIGTRQEWDCCGTIYTQSNYKQYFELAERIKNNSTAPTSTKILATICPRCNGKLIKKEAEEPFTGKKYSIDKCKNCGWC